MRRLLLALLGAAGLAVPEAAAQARADSAALAPRPEVTVPLPNGRGVFYYRAGGGPPSVRIRSRVGPPRPDSAGPVVPGPVVRPRPASGAGRPPEGVTRLDLLLLERDLLDAIDRRLAALGRGRRTDRDLLLPPSQAAPPVVVVPGQPAPPAAPPPETLAPVEPAPPPVVVSPVAPPPVVPPLVQEVERAILETGLFRTTRVHFEFGEATLIPVSESVLRAVADVLLRYPALRVEVGGHTDSVSSEAFNLRLSQRRAAAVRDYLVGAGVDAGRLVAVGYGEARPVASNATETGRALNRRVEFVVLNPEAAERAPAPEADGGAGLREILREELERLRREDG